MSLQFANCSLLLGSKYIYMYIRGNGFLDQTEFYRFLIACDCRAEVLAEVKCIAPDRVKRHYCTTTCLVHACLHACMYGMFLLRMCQTNACYSTKACRAAICGLSLGMLEYQQ